MEEGEEGWIVAGEKGEDDEGGVQECGKDCRIGILGERCGLFTGR